MICDFVPGEEIKIVKMIYKAFEKYIAKEYSELGIKNFYEFVNPEEIMNRQNSGNIIKTYKINNNIVGMIEVKENNHICLLFVDPEYHKQGIGKKLIDEIVELLKEKTDIITVNSSTFAENIYKSYGFSETDKQQEKNGIIFIPMKRTIV